jgi:hypothetical protein
LGLPQFVLIAATALGLGVTAAKSGESRGNYNFWSTAISMLIQFGILAWGGFWLTVGWPQITVVVLIFSSLGIAVAKHGESEGKYSIVTSLISAAIFYALLYFGGFFAAAG